MFEINKVFKESFNMILSYSFAIHHVEELENPNIWDFFSTQEISELSEYWPYKQYFVEFSNTSRTG